MFNQPGSNYTPFVEYVAPLLVREERLVEKQNRRSETRGLAATLTLAQWLETLRRYDWRCAFCRGRYEAMTRLVPLREGGAGAGGGLGCFFGGALRRASFFVGVDD